MAERMSDTRWKALFETEPDALLGVAGDGALREVNPAGLLLFEAERPAGVVGRTLSEFLTPPPGRHSRDTGSLRGGAPRASPEREIEGSREETRRVVGGPGPK